MEPAQRPEEGLLDEEELAAELGLREEGEVTELEGFGPSFADELEELASEIETSDGRRRREVRLARRAPRRVRLPAAAAGSWAAGRERGGWGRDPEPPTGRAVGSGCASGAWGRGADRGGCAARAGSA